MPTDADLPHSPDPSSQDSLKDPTVTLRDCVLLTPFAGMDYFPESLSGTESRELLDGWLAMWHPALIAQTRSTPRMTGASQPPHDASGVMALLPACSVNHAPSDVKQRFAEAAGWLIDIHHADWHALQQHLLSSVGMAENHNATVSALSDEFAALGYAYLQVQLVTRQLRYSSNLDQLLFDSQLADAAAAAVAGDHEQAERMLQSCFDQLGQERDHYYSLDVALLDVTLLAPSTLGASLVRQLNQSHPTTLIASAALLRKMKNEHPQSFEETKTALRDRRVCLAGGLDIERPHPLMAFDSMRRDLRRGQAAYAELELTMPVVFTRFSYGQMSDMPLHLRRSGFQGSMLVAWQEGAYPKGSHAKFSWEASEGTFLNAIAPPLVDASDASVYLTLGRQIAEALDHQHVPVFMLAHWPDHVSSYFDLLVRVVKRTPALGRWQLVDDFFEKTDQPYHQEHLPQRKFVFDWLNNSIVNTPDRVDELISASQSYYRAAAKLRTLQNCLQLCYQLENYHQRPSVKTDDADTNEYDAAERIRAVDLSKLHAGIASITAQIDAAFDQVFARDVVADGNTALDWSGIDSQLDAWQREIVGRLAKASGLTPTSKEPAQADAVWVCNPSTHPSASRSEAIVRGHRNLVIHGCTPRRAAMKDVRP